MIDTDACRQIALSFPEVTEQQHFEKTSFRVGKKIFAALDEKEGLLCIKLSETDQDLFSVFDNTIIYPVPNKWGKQGWTNVQLDNVSVETLKDALKAAFCEVAPQKLAALIQSGSE